MKAFKRTALATFALALLQLAALTCALNPFYRQGPPEGAPAEVPTASQPKQSTPLALASKSGKPAGKGDWTSCEVDSDCVRVKADCCGCSSGGSDMAINKQSLGEHRASMADCKGTVCKKVYLCQGVPENPTCDAGRCRLIRKK